jgi:phage-related protein
LELISVIDKVPKKYFDHMTGTDGIWEIRVEVGNNIFRAFSFFDEGKLINCECLSKKSQKTPRNELELAKRIQKEYFDEKETNKNLTSFTLAGIGTWKNIQRA